MNRSTKPFLSDPRNLGGRAQILQLMCNHKYSLQHIKPVLKLSTPHPHVNSAKPPHNYLQGRFYYNLIDIVANPNYAMVRATYRTINKMDKGLIDKREPKTYPLIEQLSKNKHYNAHDMREHIKNMKSLQKNLKRIETAPIQDRRKNPYDTIAYPSLFFRTKENCQDLLRSPRTKGSVKFLNILVEQNI